MSCFYLLLFVSYGDFLQFYDSSFRADIRNFYTLGYSSIG